MSTTKKLFLLGVICCLFTASSMFASTMSQTCTFGSIGSQIAISAIGTISCPFNQFNTVNGVLTDVSIQLVLGGTEWPLVKNDAQATVTNFDSVDGNLKFTFKDSSITNTTINGVGPITTPQCSGNVAAGATVTCDGNSAGVTNSKTTFSGQTSTLDPAGTSPWAAWQGAGTIAGAFTASAIFQNQNGNVNAPQMTQGGDGTFYGTLTLTYTYSSGVPEPATMSLVGGSLIALGVIARKRRKA
jgi:hypothetical protein